MAREYVVKNLGDLLVAEKPKGVLIVTGMSEPFKHDSWEHYAPSNACNVCSNQNIPFLVLDEKHLLIPFERRPDDRTKFRDTIREMTKTGLREKTDISLYLPGPLSRIHLNNNFIETYLTLRKIYGKERVYLATPNYIHVERNFRNLRHMLSIQEDDKELREGNVPKDQFFSS